MRTTLLMAALLALFTFLTPPAAARSHQRPPPPRAQVELVNRAGNPLTVLVDGVRSGVLEVADRRLMALAPGRHTVQLRYSQFGRTRVLRSVTLELRPGEREAVVLSPPATTLVELRNRTGREVRVRGAGLNGLTLAPEQARLVELPVGRSRLEFIAGSQVIDVQEVDLRAFSEQRVAARVRTGSLLVSNPLPIPVRVQGADGRSRTLQARGTLVLDDLLAGETRVTVRRTSGERIAVLRPTVRPGERVRVAVPPPTQGLVELVSEARRTTRVYVDGRLLVTVAPYEIRRVELAPGAHWVQAVDSSGRVLSRSRVWVDPVMDATVRFDERAAYASATPRRHQRP